MKQRAHLTGSLHRRFRPPIKDARTCLGHLLSAPQSQTRLEAMHKFSLAVSLLLAQGVFCALQNVSIDDTGGDPVTHQQIHYSPGWTSGPSCQVCSAKVTPPKDAFGGTWHDATYEVGGSLISASALFNGKIDVLHPLPTHRKL